MDTLYDNKAVQEIKQRLEQLEPSSQAQWGTMHVAQMLAHCTTALEMATGERNLPRVFMGRILAPFIKSMYTSAKPFPKSTPTAPALIVSDAKDFLQERGRLEAKIEQFARAGEAGCTTHPHPFFGKLSAADWGIGMYKHLDHHLRQFGV